MQACFHHKMKDYKYEVIANLTIIKKKIGQD